MKKFVIGAVMLTAALFTFQPATASTTEALTITETSITAPVAVLTADSPVVGTVPAPVAVPEPVAVIPEPVAPAPVVEPVTPIVEPVVAPTEPVEAVTPTPAPSEPVVAEPVVPVEAEPTIFTQMCTEARPCFECTVVGICGRGEALALAMQQVDLNWDFATASDRYVTLQLATAEHREGLAYIPSVANPEYVYVFTLITSELPK